MAKFGRLARLKSVIKKWPSFSKVQESQTTETAVEDFRRPQEEEDDLREVYVGKSRRKYKVSSDIISNPVFQELVDRSGGYGREEIAVTCEVVLFEHLIWMLKNSSNDGDGHGELVSAEELAGLYTCN